MQIHIESDLTYYYETVIFIIIMDTTILQVPMSKALKQSAQEVAQEYGFSSLQDLLRVVLTKLSRRELVVSIAETPILLSKRNDKRYVKMSEDFAKGKNIKNFSSIDTLMEDLHI